MFRIKSRLMVGAVIVAVTASTFLAAEPVASASPSAMTNATATMNGRKVIKAGWDDDA